MSCFPYVQVPIPTYAQEQTDRLACPNHNLGASNLKPHHPCGGMSSNNDNKNPSSPSPETTSPSILSIHDLKISLPSDVYNHLAKQYEGLYQQQKDEPPMGKACQHLNRILEQLKYSPSYTCCRINYIKSENREEVIEELKHHFWKQQQEEKEDKGNQEQVENSLVSVEPHKIFHDVILIRPTAKPTQSIFIMHGPPPPPSSPSQTTTQKRQTWPVYPPQKVIIVDRYCGEAVLRGSNIFVRGILSADANISPKDTVAVYAHLSPTKIPRGLVVKHYTAAENKCVFVGMGVAACSRQEMFTWNKGLGIKMLNNNEENGGVLPSMNGVLEEKMLMQNLPSVLVSHALLSDVIVDHYSNKGTEEGQEKETKKAKKEKLIIMDMCCAPGGKTSHMASLLHEQRQDCVIVACDKSRSKMSRARELFESMGASSVVPLALDSTKCVVVVVEDDAMDQNGLSKEWKSVDEIIAQASPSKKDGLLNIKSFYPQSFDRILLDPPCSALGLRPKLIIDDVVTNVHDLLKHAEYQRKFISNAVSLLKSGGIMTYSTCTIHAAENEEMVRYILDTFACMVLMPVSLGSVEGDGNVGLGLPGLPGVGLTEEERCMVRRFDPCDEKADAMGFFVAKFRKK